MKNIILYIRKNRKLAHLLFWLTLLILDYTRELLIFSGDKEINHYKTVTFSMLSFLPQIGFAYFCGYYVIPKFFKKQKYLLTFLYFLVGLYVFGVINRVVVVHVIEPITRTPPFEQETLWQILYQLKHLLKGYLPSIVWTSLIFVFIKFFLEQDREQTKKLNLAKEKAEIELKTLKGQLNPHFLFNTLNNIYSLSILDNAVKTSEAVAKLSEILDYVLYRCETKFVTLENEVALLKNYIELEKLRYDERLMVTMQTEIETSFKIPPLLLLSFVENAFKHGAGEDSGSPEISIYISNTKTSFIFIIKNTVANIIKNNTGKSIGLKNVRQQLDLIYGDKHRLEVIANEKDFCVTLSIAN